MKRFYRLRVTLPVAFSILMFISVTIVAVVFYVTSRETMNLVVFSNMRNIAKWIEEKNKGFFVPVERNLFLIASLFKKDVLSSDFPDNIKSSYIKHINSQKLFLSILKEYNYISSIFFGDSDGNFYMVKRDGDDFISKTVINKNGNIASEIVYIDSSFALKGEEISYDESFDPRSRIWYKKATPDGIYWSDVYTFFSDKALGITASMLVDKKKGLVIGADIKLGSLSKFISKLKIGKSGFAIIIDHNKRIIASKEYVGKERIVLKTIDSFKYKRLFRGISFPIKSGRIFGSESDEGFYYSFISPMKVVSNKWYVIISIPEEDFLGNIKKDLYKGIFIAFISLLIGLSGVYFFSKRITIPLYELSKDAKNIKEFKLEYKPNVSSIFIEIKTLADSFLDMKVGLRSFRKYFPRELVRMLVTSGKEATLGGENKRLSILFSDIAGFTSITEKLSPDELIDILGEYLYYMTRVVLRNQGTIDKFIGDAIMAFWNAPMDVKDHEFLACKTALDMHEEIKPLWDKWAMEGKPILKFRVGINTGDVIVGNMGYEDRLNYTAVGDPVNLASRLEGLGKVYGVSIIVGENTYNKVKNRFIFRKLDYVAVKGKSEGVFIYELIGYDYPSKDYERFISLYEEAFSLYLEREWDRAISVFEEALKIKEDKACRVFIDRCSFYKDNPPSEEWNGIFILKHK